MKDWGDQIVDQLKASAIKIGTEEVMNYLASLAPFFTWSWVNPIVGLAVRMVIKIVIEKTSIGIKFIQIDLRTAQEAKEFQLAALKNMEAQANGTPEAKKAAEVDVIAAARKLLVIR